MNRREFLQTQAGAAAFALAPSAFGAPAPSLSARVDLGQIAGPLHHIWAECAGSDRAAITLREAWRKDLDRWRKEAGLKRVRFHGIFNDELGVYAPSMLNRGKVAVNYKNIFQVYDGLVERGVAPFVELSFMPRALASGDQTFMGFYKGNITPPRNLEDWSGFIGDFARALVNRYGLVQVRQWPFEVWNEPNLPFFWSGNQQQYFDLYKATAVALKQIDPAIQVGGPSSAEAAWIGEFARYCAQNNAPVDFFSTHIYAGDRQDNVLGPGSALSQNDFIPAAMAKVRQTIDAGPLSGRPLWLSEWSSDSPAMIAHVIAHCLPLLRGMSQWALSGEFEELGVPSYMLKEGDGGWGMLVHGIARPSFNTYKLLHALGKQHIASTGPVLASRRPDGSTAMLVWNLAEVRQPSGIPGASSERAVQGETRRINIQINGARPGSAARVRFVDQVRGSPLPAWRQMGSPQYPTPEQMATLRRASDIASPQAMRVGHGGELSVTLPPEGVCLIEL